jgi:hypothetical protein
MAWRGHSELQREHFGYVGEIQYEYEVKKIRIRSSRQECFDVVLREKFCRLLHLRANFHADSHDFYRSHTMARWKSAMATLGAEW